MIEVGCAVKLDFLREIVLLLELPVFLPLYCFPPRAPPVDPLALRISSHLHLPSGARRPCVARDPEDSYCRSDPDDSMRCPTIPDHEYFLSTSSLRRRSDRCVFMVVMILEPWGLGKIGVELLCD